MTPAEKKQYRAEQLEDYHMQLARQESKKLKNEQVRLARLRKTVARNAAKRGKALTARLGRNTNSAKALRLIRATAKKEQSALKTAENAMQKAINMASSSYRLRSSGRSTRRNRD